jgi:hypothetical protein
MHLAATTPTNRSCGETNTTSRGSVTTAGMRRFAAAPRPDRLFLASGNSGSRTLPSRLAGTIHPEYNCTVHAAPEVRHRRRTSPATEKAVRP